MAATTVSLAQLLSSPVVTRVISQVQGPNTRLQDFFGLGPGGNNSDPVGGHVASYDIFNKTRGIAKGRPPGTGPASIAPQRVGQVPVTIYRAHEKMTLLDERIFRIRPLGQGYGQVDGRGQQYITNQEAHMAQRIKNNREFMVSRMLRGGFDLSLVGEDFLPVNHGTGDIKVNYLGPLVSGTIGSAACVFEHSDQIDYGDPTVGGGNLPIGSIAACITLDWMVNTAADIIGDLLKINAGFEEVHGYPLRHVWLNSTTMSAIMQINVGLKSVAGTANTVFNEFRPFGSDPKTAFEVVLNERPRLV